MTATNHGICPNCGGELETVGGELLRCRFCGSEFSNRTIQRQIESMQAFLDQTKIDYVNNQRNNLYKEIHARHASKNAIREYATEIKKYLPDDFQANFYLGALSGNVKKINALIRDIDVDENYELLAPVVQFLIASLEGEFLLELNNLVERAYKNRDLSLFSKFSTAISEEAEKVLEGVYELSVLRDVFIAYSSKDMKEVSKLCEELEEQGFSCFVAARNLRHGIGSVENYDEALKTAMNHCTCFLFVSGTNSRRWDCDAVRKEIPYIMDNDIRTAPAEFRHNYKTLPVKYKKPRIEYRIGSIVKSATNKITDDFFDGYEWVYDVAGVTDRLVQILTQAPEQSDFHEEIAEPAVIVQAEPIKAAPAAKPVCHHSLITIPARAVSCTQAGMTEGAICALCGEIVTPPKPIDPTGHRFGEWQITKKATCTENGEYERVCACGERETQVIPSRGGHIASEEWKTVTEPAPGKSGLKAKTCVMCGETIEEATIPALPIQKTSIGLKYKVNDDGKTCTVTGQGECKDQDIVIPKEIDGYRVTGIVGGGYYSGFSKDIASVTIPNSVTSIGGCAFCNCTSLASVTIPSSVTSIGHSVFEGCKSLASVTIPNSVTSIGEMSFAGCTSLASVTIPNSVMSIGYMAFKDCTSLASVTIPNSVTNIDGSAFAGVGEIKISHDHPAYTSINGNLYSKDKKTLIHYAANQKETSFVIPNSVTSIGNLAFCHCTSLASVTIPSSVTRIDLGAFRYCTSLASVTIPNSVTSIGNWAFSHCTSLKNIRYDGTKSQWQKVSLGKHWRKYSGICTIECTKGLFKGTITL